MKYVSFSNGFSARLLWLDILANDHSVVSCKEGGEDMLLDLN